MTDWFNWAASELPHSIKVNTDWESIACFTVGSSETLPMQHRRHSLGEHVDIRVRESVWVLVNTAL